MTRRIDVVLHNKEITRETHGLHDVQLKLDTLLHMIGKRVAIHLAGTVISQFAQIVGLQLESVQFVAAAQFLYLVHGCLVTHHHFAVFIAGKLLEQLLIGIFPAIFFFGSEIFGDVEARHDRSVVNAVKLHLIADGTGILQRLGHIRKHRVHLLTRLEPFLFGIEHTLGIIQIAVRTQTDQTVVCLGIFLIHKVTVVGTHQLHSIFMRQTDQLHIGPLLQRIGFAVGPLIRIGHLMTLQLQIIVLAEHALIPAYCLLGSFQISLQYLVGNLTGNTGRTDDQSFLMRLQLHPVGTRTAIETVGPGFRYKLDQIMITHLILGQYDQVITAVVALILVHLKQTSGGHIHLAPENRFEKLLLRFGQLLLSLLQLHLYRWKFGSGLPLLFFGRQGIPFFRSHIAPVFQGLDFLLQRLDLAFYGTVLFICIIKEFLDSHHVTVIGNGHSAHSVLDSLINQTRHTGLTVKNGVLCMYVKMNKVVHRNQIKNAISKNDFVNPENPDKVTSVSRECQTGKQLFLYLLPKEV